MRKDISVILIILLTLPFVGGYALAQGKYPERPIDMIVAFAAGASQDVTDRAVAEFLTKYLKQPIVVTNKPGGGGSIGGNALARAKPDGYTIAVFNTSQANPDCMMDRERFTYKPGDLRPVAQFSFSVPGIYVKNDAPWNSLKELAAYAKKNPDRLKWGHSGRGGQWWMTGSLFVRQAGIKMLDVPFQGDGQNLAALLGNHIDMSILTAGSQIAEQVKAKKIRPLCVATPVKYDLMPDAPSSTEAGYPIDVRAYVGIFVPKATPEAVVAKLIEVTKKTTEDSQFKEKMRQMSVPILFRGGKDFETHVKEYGEFKCKSLKELGVL